MIHCAPATTTCRNCRRRKTHEAIAAAKTQIQHRILTHYLPLYFPEIDRFRGNSRSDWFFAFLDAFPPQQGCAAAGTADAAAPAPSAEPAPPCRPAASTHSGRSSGRARPDRRHDAASSITLLSPRSRSASLPWASELSQRFLQRRHVQDRFRQQLLDPPTLILEALQPPGIRLFHSRQTPVVEGCLRDPVLAA